MMPSPDTAFTCRYPIIVPALVTDVELFPPVTFTPPGRPLGGIKYKALFDTGATHSSISPKVVADLSLASIGATNVGVGGGILTTTSHLVNIGFPNGVMFQLVRVAKVAVHQGIEALIGMDIISQGDLSVTNHGGKTTFSFCCPSRREIDFVAEINAANVVTQVHSDKVGRNQLCPCGSGKKYKKCHGQ
jgi:hypothetical protein